MNENLDAIWFKRRYLNLTERETLLVFVSGSIDSTHSLQSM